MSDGRMDSEREREMRAVLERWERSGLPIARFASCEGLTSKTLYRWRQRLGIGDGRVRRGRPLSDAPAPLFTEVSPSLLTVRAAVFEVVLPSGVTLRVPERFEPDALRRLIAVLGAC